MAKRPDWRRLLTAGILLAGGMASVDARTIYPEPGSLQLSYDVYKGGFHMLAADLDVEFGAGHYDITAQIRAQGAFAWWTNWRQVVRVTGRFTPWGPTPNAYRSEAYVSGTQRQVAIDYVDGDDSVWEREPVDRLVRDGQLMGYRHYGFWSCMDTLKEKQMLEEMWASGAAPWRIWDAAREPVAAGA